MPLFRVTFENRKHGFKRTLRVGAPDSEFAEDKAADLFFAGMTSTTKKLRPRQSTILTCSPKHSARRSANHRGEKRSCSGISFATTARSTSPSSPGFDRKANPAKLK
jgi:hypothetical protein